MPHTTCNCLYCGQQTGHYPSPETGERKTICHKCAWLPARDEAREVAAGMRPWARPATGFSGKPMSDEDAAVAQRRWDEEQAAISAGNLARQKTNRETVRQ